MRIHDITHDDMKNGTGLRVVLWTAGCEHCCKECHNPVTWDPNYGIDFTPWEESEFFEWLAKPWTEGATFSGGDPLHPNNRNEIGRLCKIIKDKYPEKNIWLYTGYKLKKTNAGFVFENKKGDELNIPWLNLVDVLVDGAFEIETRKEDVKNNKKVPWRGSSNQGIVDIQKTLSSGKIVYIDDKEFC